MTAERPVPTARTRARGAPDPHQAAGASRTGGTAPGPAPRRAGAWARSVALAARSLAPFADRVRASAAVLVPAGPVPAPAGGPPVPGRALREAQRSPRPGTRPARPAAARPRRPAAPSAARTSPARPAPRAPRPAPRGPRRAVEGVRRLYLRAKRAWDRPLTAYYVILGGSLLITALGLVMVFSASQIKALGSGLPSTYFFRKQLLAAALGALLMLAAARMPLALLRGLAYPVLAGSVFLLCLVQVPGIGQEVKGNQNWLHLGGPFQLQPSEFAKLALVLWGADLLARKGDKRLLVQWKHMLVPLVPVTFLLLGLIMLGRDMGTAIILAAILIGLLWLAGAPLRLFAGVLALVAVIGAVLIGTNPNRMSRLDCLGATDPGPNDACWQAVHGIYALASGGWFGSGLGDSMEKWGQLPEPHTDFIFAVTGEELGLTGTLSVLALFAALGYAGIRVAGRTEDPFVRYAAGGVTTWIMAQAVVNIGAVLGLLPIAGVPLPLFSYGGSALLPTMFAVGLLISCARTEPAAKAALAMRQPAVRKKPAGVRRKTMRRSATRRPSGER